MHMHPATAPAPAGSAFTCTSIAFQAPGRNRFKAA